MADPSPAQRRLAAALRTLRMRSGLSAAALARQLGPGWTQTKVSRTELAQRRISTADANQWADATGADDERPGRAGRAGRRGGARGAYLVGDPGRRWCPAAAGRGGRL